MPELGLFPLGIVLLPSERVPLHVFEERYKELIGECVAPEQEFGLLYADDSGLRELGGRAAVVEVLERFDGCRHCRTSWPAGWRWGRSRSKTCSRPAPRSSGWSGSRSCSRRQPHRSRSPKKRASAPPGTAGSPRRAEAPLRPTPVLACAHEH